MRRTFLSVSGSPSLIAPFPPAITATGAAWTLINRALFMRFHQPAADTRRYLNFEITVASGNIQYGIVKLSGANRTTYTRRADSGVIACPAAAAIHGDFGATLLEPGDYAAYLWADNVTFAVRSSQNTGVTAARVAGNATVSGGVPASGTLSWGSLYFGCTVEGDV